MPPRSGARDLLAAEAQESAFRATSLSTLAQMVHGGAGITLLPRLAVRAESRRAHLAVRRFVDPAPHRTLVVAWRQRSPLGAAMVQVAAALREAYARAEPKLEAALGRPVVREGRTSAAAASPAKRPRFVAARRPLPER